MRSLIITTAVLTLSLAACGSADTAEQPAADTADTSEVARAAATLQNAEGETVGNVIATAVDTGIQIELNVDGIDAGEHGVHVHAVGSCEAPDFASAGGHWNPGERQHGLENPQGSHAGDMPNLTVAADRTGRLEFILPAATLSGLLDTDGAAFVVHAGADDQVTDPSGDSGSRIACGVFSAS